jgi:hypothetical protein
MFLERKKYDVISSVSYTIIWLQNCITIAAAISENENIKNCRRIFTMLDTPVPIRTLKLSSIGPVYYLDGRPFKEFQVLLAPIPLSPLRTEYSLFRLSLSQSSDWDPLKPKKQKKQH